MTDATAVETLTYVEASAELDVILAALERDDVDVDLLAAQVRRAGELVRYCRDRLAASRLEVDRVVADLDAQEAAPSPTLPGLDPDLDADDIL